MNIIHRLYVIIHFIVGLLYFWLLDQTNGDVVVVVIGHYARVKVDQIQGRGEAVLSATVIVIVVCVLARRQYAAEIKHMFNNDQFVTLINDLLFI